MVNRLVSADSDSGKLPDVVMSYLSDNLAISGHPKTAPSNTRLAAWGHSIIAAGDGTALNYGDSIQNMLSAFSGDKLELIRNAGFAGETSTQILSHFGSHIAPANPGVVFIMARTNDAAGGVSLAQSKANHVEMVSRVRGIGAVPIMSTTTPVGQASAAIKLENAQFDAWLRAFCATEQIICVEAWAATVSTAANDWPSADWTNDGGTGQPDGTHPLPLAQKRIAEAVVAKLPNSWPTRPRAAVTAGDPTNLVVNPLMLADANADGLADSWTENGGPNATSRTYSLVTDTQVPGRMQRITLDEQGGTFAQLAQDVPVNGSMYSPGDVFGVYVTVTMEDTAKAAARGIRLSLVALEGGGPAFEDHSSSLTVGVPTSRTTGVVKHERAVLSQRFVAREGIYVCSVRMLVQAGVYSGGIGGKGYAQFGAVRLVNLTRLGLA